MGTDFLELFKHLETVEVSEPALYKLIDEAHSLILTQHRNSVPNTLRKFYECILYKCKKENIKLIYKENGIHLDVSRTSKKLFEKEPDLYKDTIRPFLEFVNGCSHCYDADYATVKKSELYKCIGHVITIWNWYARIKNLDSKYLIRSKYDLPEPQNYHVLEDKIKSKEAKIKDLQDKLAESETENKDLQDKLEEAANVQKEQEEDENISLDMKELEKDILQTVNDFIKDDIYCTHRTIALFLLGDRIAHTDFKNLDERELFGKYSKNKFSAFEYDMALQNLIEQEDIIQIGVYYHPFDKNMTRLQKWVTVLKTKLYFKLNLNKNYNKKINKKYVKIIQKAIDENKKIKMTYCKSKANKIEKDVSVRVIKPVRLLERREDISGTELSQLSSETPYYLRAVDDKDNQEKTFKLDGIKNPKIL